MLPAAVVLIAVIALVLSNYQKEAGIYQPTKGGVLAVSAAVTARGFSDGQMATDYSRFADALLYAAATGRQMPDINPADTRLSHIMVEVLDCLYASREAWQAQVDDSWDPAIQGTPEYWTVLHPSLALPAGKQLTAADVRRLSAEQASKFLKQATDLIG